VGDGFVGGVKRNAGYPVGTLVVIELIGKEVSNCHRDAVIVRTLLVPAIVALMGRWNWWVPSGLAKIVGVERA
jgi:uncharacterized membrane protein YdfJ with MMPL/SSD domain